ncbi:hypothetical protein GCM10009716_31550 [Streptomyces sodiiphilus]|uniref:LPXTG cell wall anchor domain-containing protein n=1 Tax=Streptomyces sodiiphilus TaxID=226217 RepID=A0ABP5AR56_9ACTN
MKLRRAVATAAAAAVVAPAALLAGTAHASEPTDGPTAAVEQMDETPEEDPQGDEANPAEEAEEEATEEAAADETGDTIDDEESDNGAGDDGSDDNGSDDKGDDAEGTPGDGLDEGDDEIVEECTDIVWNEDIHTELIGLPSKVVAGQWTEFTFRVSNNSDKPMDAIDAFAEVAAWDGEEFEDVPVTLQWSFDGTWHTVNDEWGYFGTAGSLQPGEYAEATMRLKVDASAPAGFGLVITSGVYIDENGACELSDLNVYEFDVVPAGTDVKRPEDAKGEKSKGNKPAPQGEFEQIEKTGTLAETGADSVLPMFALAGAAAVALGAGAVFLVRRRETGSPAAS